MESFYRHQAHTRLTRVTVGQDTRTTIEYRQPRLTANSAGVDLEGLPAPATGVS